MAIEKENRNAVVGVNRWTDTTSYSFLGAEYKKETKSHSANVLGTSLDFSGLRMGDKDYSGTLYLSNTYSNSSGSVLDPTTQAQTNAAKNFLADPFSSNIEDIKTFGSIGSVKDDGFFSTFYNYYLGLAQDRQANLSKNLGRSDLLSNNTGSLL